MKTGANKQEPWVIGFHIPKPKEKDMICNISSTEKGMNTIYFDLYIVKGVKVWGISKNEHLQQYFTDRHKATAQYIKEI